MSKKLDTITLGMLKERINVAVGTSVDYADETLAKPIRVWLPGSTIALSGSIFWNEDLQCFLIEGNVDPGSALYD